MRRTLLLIAAAFAAGIGVGVLLQPEGAPDRAGRPARPGEAQPAPTADAPAPADPSPLPTPLPEIPKGDGRIRGSVLDEAGGPLADVLVVATPIDTGTPRKGSKAPAGPPDEDLNEMARQTIARQKWLRDGRRTARTGPDGTYELPHLGAIRWNLQAYREGYVLRAASGNAYGAEPGAVVDFAGGRVVRVNVDMRLPDGSRPASGTVTATVRKQGGSSSSSENWIASEPWIELRPQPYELFAATETAKSRPQTVTIDARGGQSILFELEGRPGLRVTVVRPEDLSAIQPEVLALRFAGGSPPDPARLRTEGTRTTGPRGETAITFQDLEPGSYLIGAAYSYADPVAVTKVVEVGAAMAEHELRLPPIDPKEYLLVRVRDPEGGSPRPLQFTLVRRAGAQVTGDGVQALVRNDGVHLVRRPAPADGGTRFAISAECALGRVEQPFDPAAPREILIQFEVPAFLDASIADYARSPHAGWLGLALARRDEQGRSHRFFDRKPGPEGASRLGPAQPGSYELALYVTPESWTIATVPVQLRSGDQAATIAVPALHELRVRWPGSGKRVFRIGRKDLPSARPKREMTEDTATVERLAAGVYEIIASGIEKPIEVEIPKQAEVEIK